MKASDITDAQFLAALDAAAEAAGADTASRWDITWQLSGNPGRCDFTSTEPPAYPEKVVLAKANSLLRRKAISGCACGCRGDFKRTKSTDV